MDTPSIPAVAQQMVEAVRAAVAKSEAALNARIDALTLQAGPKGDKGEPGANGNDGASIDMPALKSEVASWVQDAVKLIAPRDGMPGRDGRDATGLPGKDGKDGKDGFSLDDFTMALADDGRTLSLKFSSGEKVVERSIQLETLIWRDIWQAGEYKRGDVVTWGGSSWHCQNKTTGKPGECDDWKMMVKKGSAGRDWNDPKAKAEHKIVRTA